MTAQVQTDPARPVLVAFDGSAASRQAILAVAGLSPGRASVILTVSTPGNLGLEQFESEEALAEERSIDAGDLDQAQALADKGAALAAAAGLPAEAATLQTTGPAWTAITDHARTIGAGLIAVGARNRHPVVDDLLGSQTLKVLQHADVPVLVVRLPQHPTTVDP
jgi:nucleotide-binding universal stress UspA family protein